MAIAKFLMPFPDFDYAGWAEQIGLHVVSQSGPNKYGHLEFIVEGSRDAIAQFEGDLDFKAENVTPSAGDPGPALLTKLLNNFGR